MKYKARWVAYGFKQEKSINFVKKFAVVIKSMLYKCLFRVSVKRRYKNWQMDIMTAFLYRFFNKIIYVKQFYLFDFNFKLVYYLRKT